MENRTLTDQLQFLRPRHRLGAPLYPQLTVDMARMGLDRVQGNEQPVADFLVRAALGDQLQHRHLPGAQGLMAG